MHIPATAIKDTAATPNSFSGLPAWQYNFTTKADTAAPLLISSVPSNQAVNVSLNSTLQLTFGEPIVAGTGNIEVSVGGTTVSSMAVTNNSITFGNRTVTIAMPIFAHMANVSVVVPSGTILDKARNPNSWSGWGEGAYTFSTIPITYFLSAFTIHLNGLSSTTFSSTATAFTAAVKQILAHVVTVTITGTRNTNPRRDTEAVLVDFVVNAISSYTDDSTLRLAMNKSLALNSSSGFVALYKNFSGSSATAGVTMLLVQPGAVATTSSPTSTPTTASISSSDGLSDVIIGILIAFGILAFLFLALVVYSYVSDQLKKQKGQDKSGRPIGAVVVVDLQHGDTMPESPVDDHSSRVYAGQLPEDEAVSAAMRDIALTQSTAHKFIDQGLVKLDMLPAVQSYRSPDRAEHEAISMAPGLSGFGFGMCDPTAPQVSCAAPPSCSVDVTRMCVLSDMPLPLDVSLELDSVPALGPSSVTWGDGSRIP